MRPKSNLASGEFGIMTRLVKNREFLMLQLIDKSLVRRRRFCMIRILPLLVLLISLTSLTACSRLNGYACKRAADLADILTLEISAGPGAHVFIQATDFAGTGLGYSDQQGLWLHGRHVGYGKRSSVGLALMAVSGSEPRDYALKPWIPSNPHPFPGDSLHYTEDARGSMYFVLPIEYAFSGSMEYLKEQWWRTADISLGASALVGFHACASPGEFIDFIAGLFSIDIAQDDISIKTEITNENLIGES